MSKEINLGRGSVKNPGIEPGIDSDAQWIKQSQALARHFATKLGLSTKEYINALPKFKPQPEFFKGKLDIPVVPVIVETRIVLPEMVKILNIDYFLDPQKIQDWSEGGFKTQSDPYTTWVTYILPRKSVKEIRVDLSNQEDKRGGTVFDGIALYLINRQLLNRYCLDFPGSQVGPDDAPFLFAFSNSVESSVPKPFLSYGWVESLASRKFASVIASRI